MRRFVPRALLTAVFAVLAASCAAGGNAGIALGGDTGGRSIMMIPDLEGAQGPRVAEALRGLVFASPTHTVISAEAIETQMEEYQLEVLDEITARQLAQQNNLQLVSWGAVEQSPAGLAANIRFIDTRTGDEIEIDATGATPQAVAGEIFGQFTNMVEGMRQAAYCNDDVRSQNYAGAMTTCEAALAVLPNSLPALYGKATALLNTEKYAEALQTYERLLALDPNNSDAILRAGLASSRMNNREQAQRYYTRFLEVNPANLDLRLNFASQIAQTGDYVSAFGFLESAIDQNRENTEFQKIVFTIGAAAGQGLLQAGDTTEARAIFNKALPSYRLAFPGGQGLDLATLQAAIAATSGSGDVDAAINLAREGTQQFAREGAIWSQYAQMLTNAGRHGEAVQALTQLIGVDPNYQQVYVRRGQAHLAMADFTATPPTHVEPALADLAQAAQRGEGNNASAVLYAAGVPHVQSRNWAVAAQLLAPAHEYATDPQRKADIGFFLGLAYFNQAQPLLQAMAGSCTGSAPVLDLVRRALPLAQAATQPQAAQIAQAAQQIATSIENAC